MNWVMSLRCKGDEMSVDIIPKSSEEIRSPHQPSVVQFTIVALWMSGSSTSFLFSDQSRGQRRPALMVHCQTPCGVDPQTWALASDSAVHPEELQFLHSGNSSCSSASGSRGCEPVQHACLVQHHRYENQHVSLIWTFRWIYCAFNINSYVFVIQMLHCYNINIGLCGGASLNIINSTVTV